MGFLKKLSSGLSKTRASFTGNLKNIFSGRVDEEFFEELEESLFSPILGSVLPCNLANVYVSAPGRIKSRKERPSGLP